MYDDLPQMMHDAADDEFFNAPDLRPAARARARRRRALTAGAVAAVLAGTVGVGYAVINAAEPVTVAEPGPTQSAPAGTPAPAETPRDPLAPVPHDEIVEWCAPQVATFRLDDQFLDAASIQVAHPHEYLQGQLVTLLAPATGETRLCHLDPDPDATSAPAVDPASDASILEHASEALRTCTDDGACSYDTPDLRQGTVVAKETLDDVVAALVTDGKAKWLVTIPPTGQPGATDLTEHRLDSLEVTFAGTQPSDGARYVAMGGYQPALATSIDYEHESDGAGGAVEVTDGHYLTLEKVAEGDKLVFNVRSEEAVVLAQGRYFTDSGKLDFVKNDTTDAVRGCEHAVKRLRAMIEQPNDAGISEVVSSAKLDKYLVALVISDDERFACHINPYGASASNFTEDKPVPGSLWDRERGNVVAHPVAETDDVGGNTFYMGSGDLTPEAATIELTTAAGETHTVEVVDSVYTFVFKSEHPYGTLTYRVLDADGKLLHTGTIDYDA